MHGIEGHHIVLSGEKELFLHSKKGRVQHPKASFFNCPQKMELKGSFP
jgi:hypothetical protein